MSDTIDKDDKIFVMFKKYRKLLEDDPTMKSHVRTTQIAASNLTLAHMIDHVVCLLKIEE
jgi:hypothetical protein|tara:strand:+ start:264 stop:443 length:180 start_codon:yes stop_codon:yes gene_type:complete